LWNIFDNILIIVKTNSFIAASVIYIIFDIHKISLSFFLFFIISQLKYP